MSGLDESGTPLQERIEIENIYERFRQERALSTRLQDELDADRRASHERQIHIYATMAEAAGANTYAGDTVLIDEDLSLQRRQRESNHGIFHRLLNSMRGRGSESYSRRNNRGIREGDRPTIDFVA